MERNQPMQRNNVVRQIVRGVFRFSLRRLLVCVILLAVGMALLLRPAWQRHRIHQQIAAWGGTVYESISVSSLPTETTRQRLEHAYWEQIERLLGKDCADSCVRIEFSGTLAKDDDLLFLGQCSDLRSIFVNNADVGDRLAAALSKLSGLYTVDLEGTRVTDAGLERLSACPSLRVINVTETYVTRAGVAKLQKAIPAAEIHWSTSASDAHWHAQRQLARSGVNISAEGMRFGSNEQNEYTCTVTLGTGNVYLDDILPLEDMDGNIRLRLIQTSCPPAMCSFLGSLRNVGLMSLDYVAFEDLDWIARMQNLYDLSIEYTVGKQHDLSFLSVMPDLRRLELRRIRFRDEDILQLPAEMKLEELRIPEAEITDASLDRIASFKQLRRLDLTETAITDAGAIKLAALDQLEWLRLTRTSIGDEAIAAIATLPQLKILYLNRTHTTVAGLRELAATKSLTHLTVLRSDVGEPPPDVIRQFDRLEEFTYDRAND
jgi:hypothetical protein